MKTDWNRVRDRSTSDEVRTELLKKMVQNMDTHVLQVTLRHDASRIIQCVLQFGTLEQKQKIYYALLPKAFEIAKTPYGHFTILKAITYCTGLKDQEKLVKALKSHFVSLGTNVIGSRTVESILQIYPITITKSLRSEFYGQVMKEKFL